MTKTVSTNKINRFHKLVSDGVVAWTKAGKLLVEIVDADPDAYEAILDGAQGLTRAHLAKFESIGRGSLEPRLLLNGSPGYHKLQHSPLSTQKKALKDGIKLYEPDGNGGITHRIVRPEDLSPFEVSQVFAPGGAVRSPEEQMAYLAKRDSRRKVTKGSKTLDLPDYKIVRGKVVFNAGCTLTASQVAGILSELTKK
jgi:hypothetical protein